MSRTGPDGQPYYSLVDAYDAIGRALFGDSWQLVFAPGQTRIGPAWAQEFPSQVTPDTLVETATFEPQDGFRYLQFRQYRTEACLSVLKEALTRGRATAIRKSGEGWNQLAFVQWRREPDLWAQVTETLHRFVLDNQEEEIEILLDCGRLDAHLAAMTPPGPAQRKPKSAAKKKAASKKKTASSKKKAAAKKKAAGTRMRS